MTPSFISQATHLLDDPIMMDWALHYYHNLSPRSTLKEQIENLWFHDVAIKRWMDSDNNDILSRIFRYLPAQRFSMFIPTIAKYWANWPTNLSDSSAKILMSIAPDTAAETFGRYMDSPQTKSVEKVSIILSTLDKFTSEVALPLFEMLLPMAWVEDKMIASIIRQDAFKVAVKHNPTVLPRLLDSLFAESKNRLDDAVEFMAACLFGHSAYANLYLMLRKNHIVINFIELERLFDKNAPLGEMDEIVKSDTPLPAALQLLKIHHGRSKSATLAWEIISQSEIRANNEHPIELAALVIAGVAAAFELQTIETNLLSLEDTIALIALDITTNIHYDSLIARVQDFTREDIIQTVMNSMKLVKDTYGEVTLARLMGDLGWVEFIEPLMNCIGESKGDYVCEAAKEALLLIGDTARDALISRWNELDTTQQIYGGSVIARVGGQAVADFAYDHFDALLRSDFEFLCRLLQTEPDLRLLQRLRPELRRKQEIIDETFFRLCHLLNVKDELLPEVQQRIEWNEIKRQNALANFEKGDFVSDRHSLNLRLICADCGETNDYEVKGISLAPKGWKHVIADELHCLSCGALSEFQFTQMAFMTLVAEVIRLEAASKAGDNNIRPLVSNDQVRVDGKVQPLPVAYADLRDKISKNSNDSLSLFRLGNILAGIYRPKAALNCFRKAHTSNPLSIDATINFAYTLSNANQKQEAFTMLSNALKNSEKWHSVAGHPTEKGPEFAKIYNQLLSELGRNDLPVLHPEFLGAAPKEVAISKVGRNDTCPCGSGKKFKKCCMK